MPLCKMPENLLAVPNEKGNAEQSAVFRYKHIWWSKAQCKEAPGSLDSPPPVLIEVFQLLQCGGYSAIGRHRPIVGIVYAHPSVESLESKPRMAGFKNLFEDVFHSMQGPLPLRWKAAVLHSPQSVKRARGFGQSPENRSNCVVQDNRQRSVKGFCLPAGEKRG